MLPALTSDDVRALADVGFIALSRGLDRHAMAIFTGVAAARPEQDAGPIGIALVHLLRGEVDDAIERLRKQGPSDAALTFLAVALTRKGELAAAREVIAMVQRSGSDAPFAALATETLAAIDAAR